MARAAQLAPESLPELVFCSLVWRGVLSPKSALSLENTVRPHINLDKRRAAIQNLICCLIKIFLYLSPISNYQNVNPITWLSKSSNEEKEQCILAKLNFLYLRPMSKKTKIWSCSIVSNLIAPRKELALRKLNQKNRSGNTWINVKQQQLKLFLKFAGYLMGQVLILIFLRTTMAILGFIFIAKIVLKGAVWWINSLELLQVYFVLQKSGWKWFAL